MKILNIAALALGIMLLGLAQVRAEGFLDLYGGFAKFSGTDMTQSYVIHPPGTTQQNFDYPDSKILDSYDAGFRVGNTWKGEHLNFSIAYDNSFYNVGALPGTSSNLFLFPASGGALGTYWKDAQGGLVIQPGIQALLGIPLRYARAYVGVGLVTPIMFYNYDSYDPLTNTLKAHQLGTSGAIGDNFIIGGRWFITKRLNLMIEDRIQTLFTPMVIKNSYYVPDGNYFVDSTVTMKTLNANQLLIGLGFTWGGQ
jgi:hypothetical protein